MRPAEVYRLAVLLERHENAIPSTSVALATNIMSTATVYEMGGFAVELDDLVQRHRQTFPWMFKDQKETQ